MQPHKDDPGALCLSEALVVYRDQAISAQQTYNGRELMLFESHPERIGRLIDLLVESNYRETACRIVGVSSRAVRMWMQRAEEGDPRYEAVARAILVAESLAEAAAVRAVRAAGKNPRFLAATMTFLERRWPDKWGRRPIWPLSCASRPASRGGSRAPVAALFKNCQSGCPLIVRGGECPSVACAENGMPINDRVRTSLSATIRRTRPMKHLHAVSDIGSP